MSFGGGLNIVIYKMLLGSIPVCGTFYLARQSEIIPKEFEKSRHSRSEFACRRDIVRKNLVFTGFFLVLGVTRMSHPLAIVKHICALTGGNIILSSQEGQGTCISINWEEYRLL